MKLSSARQVLDRACLREVLRLYANGVLDHDEVLMLRVKYMAMNKKQLKQIEKQKALLEAEIAALEAATVNDTTSDLMRVAAPDTYLTLRHYLERRLRDLIAPQGV